MWISLSVSLAPTVERGQSAAGVSAEEDRQAFLFVRLRSGKTSIAWRVCRYIHSLGSCSHDLQLNFGLYISLVHSCLFFNISQSKGFKNTQNSFQYAEIQFSKRLSLDRWISNLSSVVMLGRHRWRRDLPAPNQYCRPCRHFDLIATKISESTVVYNDYAVHVAVVTATWPTFPPCFLSPLRVLRPQHPTGDSIAALGQRAAALKISCHKQRK